MKSYLLLSLFLTSNILETECRDGGNRLIILNSAFFGGREGQFRLLLKTGTNSRKRCD